MDLTQTITAFSEALTLILIVPLVLFAGIYFTWRLRGIQVFQLKRALSHLLRQESKKKGSISHFEALSVVLAGNLGTGNISGMAIALAAGGPGALVWMWVMAFFGAVLKYAGCLLGVLYRHTDEAGEYVGGPMYYISRGVKSKKLATLFSLLTVASAFTVGNLVQINSIILPLEALGFDRLLWSIALAAVIGVVILGGLKRIAGVVAMVVPAMTAMYLGCAAVILLRHIDAVPSAFGVIISSAFAPTALAGGAAGYGVAKAVSMGFERGIFATDAGVGIAPVLQSGARTQSAAVEGIVAMVAPLVVMVVCTVTSLVLVVTGAYRVEGLQSTNMCTWAFETGLGHPIAKHIVIAALFLFAMTTILAWEFCAAKAIEFMVGIKAIRWFQVLFVACIPIGAIARVELVWAVADISIALMLCCNMVGVLALRKQVLKESAEMIG